MSMLLGFNSAHTKTPSLEPVTLKMSLDLKWVIILSPYSMCVFLLTFSAASMSHQRPCGLSESQLSTQQWQQHTVWEEGRVDQGGPQSLWCDVEAEEKVSKNTLKIVIHFRSRLIFKVTGPRLGVEGKRTYIPQPLLFVFFLWYFTQGRPWLDFSKSDSELDSNFFHDLSHNNCSLWLTTQLVRLLIHNLTHDLSLLIGKHLGIIIV